MTDRELLDAIGMLPQDMIAEALPKQEHAPLPADDSAPAVNKIQKNKGNPNIALRLGAAVAAFCFLASGAVVYGVIRMQRSGSAQASLADSLSEQTQHRYVTMMQEYYTSCSGTPCTYDFSGMGADLSETWEAGNYTLTMTAIAGDAFQLYYFYDITLKDGAEWGEVMPMLHVSADYSDERTGFPFGNWGKNLSDKNRMLSEEEGVRHMAGVLQDLMGFGFQEAEIHAHVSESEFSGETGDTREIACDFITAPHYTDVYDPEGRLTVSGYPLRRAAATRLGVYFTESDVNAYDYGTALIRFDDRLSPDRAFAVPEECEAWQLTQIPSPVSDTVRPLGAPRIQDGIMRHIADEQSGESMTVLLLPYAEPLTEAEFLNGYLSVNGCRIALGSPLPDFTAENPQDTPNAEDTQNYVTLMQEYYSTKKMNGEPCNFDFTGMGTDYEESLWHPDCGGYTIRLRAFAGDAFTLHCFYDVIPDDQDTWKEKDPESLLWTLHPSIGLNVIGADGSFLTVDSLTHQELLEIETAADGTVILHEHIAVVSGDGTPFTGASAKLVAGSSIIMSRDIAVRSEVVPLKYLTEAPQFYEGADPVQPGSAVQFAVTPLGAYGMCPEEGVSDSGFYSFRAEYTGGETAAVTSCVMAAGESYSAYVFDLPQNLEDLTSLTLGQIVISMKPE